MLLSPRILGVLALALVGSQAHAQTSGPKPTHPAGEKPGKPPHKGPGKHGKPEKAEKPERPADKPGGAKPADKPAEKPADKAPPDRPADKAPPDRPADKAPPDRPADKGADKPADRAADRPAAQLRFDVKRTKLENGLRVVMLVDHTSPTVAVDVVYDVGGRNEERGRSGFAHLFEHMMFQGSANVGRGEHFKLVTAHGGSLNGTTNEDRTNYFEMLPSSELALGLWLEADRMKSLDISQKNFENQRAVVKEEYRMRVENAAYVPAAIRVQELTYQGYWPYEHSAIGTMRDLDAAELGWVRDFHSKYYGPNNAVLSVAGDFDEGECLALIKRYFGDARPVPAPKPELPPVPEQTAPRSAVVEDTHAKLPALFEGWVIPKTGEPDHYALSLAGMILSDGESSRLYRSLVRERSLAIDVEAETDDRRGPDMFEVVVKLASGAKIADAQRLVDGSLADLAKLGPSDEEMKKVRTRIQARFLIGLQSNFARAQRLAELELFRGDAALINSELDRYLAVTKDDIKRVVGKYLVKERRTTVEVKPGAGAKS